MSAGTAFTTIRTEGAILPPDILSRIAAGDKDLGGLTEAAYHLTGEKFGEATNRAWNRLQSAWLNFQTARQNLPPGDAGTTITRERWLLPLCQFLDYGRLQTSKAHEIGGKTYAVSHAWQNVPIHLVGCNVDLESRQRGTSPHSLLQEFLNRSEGHLWGIVSNGLRLRLLRDNISLTRQAYVEFDLEAMMAGEAYPDFVLLWLLLHQSRFEGERPELAWIEKWSQSARTEGVRVLDGLRDGVQRAIESLGQGALAHPANTALRESLRSGSLDKQDYYRELLRLVYRLIFLFVAEDRSLLLDPSATPEARERYTKHYAVARIRRLAVSKAGSRHDDLYRALKFVMVRLSSDGCPELAIPALGSFLFSPNSMPNLDTCEISNRDLLAAVRSLAVTQTKQGRRGVDYKNLGAEELGSVYESLLELHPALDAAAASFELKVATGSERKTSGSYYTPTSLISCLLDSALDPVLHEASNQPDPEATILKLKVVDPACGSGHFLIAAAHRIAKRLAAVRTGEEEPPPEAQRKALRSVIGHCIYGVDVNPMAVELCKVSLWMEALEPGKPLSFLEHRIQCGNSLLGTTPALLAAGIPDEAFTPIEGDDKEICKEFKRINKDERNKQLRLFAATTEPWLQLGNFAASLMNLDTVGDDSIEGIREKERMYEEAIRSGNYLDGRFWADTWCAAFVWKKTRDFSYPITEEVFRRIERNPHACDAWMRDEIKRLAHQYGFFHWHLAFPDVFRLLPAGTSPENEQAGWSGGFDVVLGNPPWEMPETDDRVFFAEYRPEIASEPSAQKRRVLIQQILEETPWLWQRWEEHVRGNMSQRVFFAKSGSFPNSGGGRLNYYRLFVEVNWNLLRLSGSLGMVVPSGLATNKYEEPMWHHLLKTGTVARFLDFENSEGLFPEIDRRTKFSLLTARRGLTGSILVGCWLKTVDDLTEVDRIVPVTVEELREFDPDSLSLPQFRNRRDLVLLKAAYGRFGRLSAAQEWAHTPKLMFSSSDADFQPVTNVDALGWHLQSNGRRMTPDSVPFVPVYEGKMVGIYDHRQADIVINPKNPSRQAQEQAIDAQEKINPSRLAIPQHWLREDLVRRRRFNPIQRDWTLAFCDVTSATNERTCIASVLPLCGLTRTMAAIYLKSAGSRDALVLQSILSSLPLDYYARLKVATNHLTQGILESLPIPSISRVDDFAASIGEMQFVNVRALELIYTAWDLQPFAADLGREGPPFRWDDSRRFLLRCELDALYFRVYGLSREDAAYILDTFPSIRRKDEVVHGQYRTKRVILEIYDAIAESEGTGVRYQTSLDPAPADPRVAHAPAVTVQAQPAPIPPPMLVPSLDLVANGAWATPPGIQPGNFVLLAVTEVLHRFGGQVDPHRVWMAVHFLRNPAVALAFLDKVEVKDWVRVIGPAAQPVPKNVVDISSFRRGATDQLWGETIIYLKSINALVESSGLWSAASTALVPADEEWLAGRADVAVRLASKLVDEEETELQLAEFMRSVQDGTARRAVS